MRRALWLLVLVLISGGSWFGYGTYTERARDDRCAALDAQASAEVAAGNALLSGPTPGSAEAYYTLPSERARQEAEGRRRWRVGMRIVVNHPECFDAKTVAAAQDRLEQMGGH